MLVERQTGIRQTFPIPNRLNLLLTIFQVSVSLALLVWASHAPLWQSVIAALLFSFIMQTGFSLLHEAEHGKLHANRYLNDAQGWLLAAMFPGSYHVLRLAHLNHHRVNRSDAELVDYVRPGESRLLKSLQYYFLIHGGIWLGAPLISIVIFLTPRTWLHRFLSPHRSGNMARYLGFFRNCKTTAVRLDCTFAIVFWLISWHLLGLHWQGVLLCYGFFAFSWSSQQYIYHIRSPRHLTEGAFDLALLTPLRWLYLNFNLHLSHHRTPLVPWIYMPQLTSEPKQVSYLRTYIQLWRPPQTIDHAQPVDFQEHGPLLPVTSSTQEIQGNNQKAAEKLRSKGN